MQDCPASFELLLPEKQQQSVRIYFLGRHAKWLAIPVSRFTNIAGLDDTEGDFRTLNLPVPLISVGSVGSDYIRFSHYIRLVVSMPSWLPGENNVSVDTRDANAHTPASDPSFGKATAEELGICPTHFSYPNITSPDNQDASSNQNIYVEDLDSDMILEAASHMRQQDPSWPLSDGCLVNPIINSETAVEFQQQQQAQLSWDSFWVQKDLGGYSAGINAPPSYCNLDPNQRYPPTLTRMRPHRPIT